MSCELQGPERLPEGEPPSLQTATERFRIRVFDASTKGRKIEDSPLEDSVGGAAAAMEATVAWGPAEKADKVA